MVYQRYIESARQERKLALDCRSAISIEGDISDPEAQTWDAFTAILKNACVQAFSGDVEKTIELERLDVDKSQQEAQTRVCTTHP